MSDTDPAAPSSSPVTTTPAPTDAKPPVVFDEFARLDLRVARVLTCEVIPKSDRLFKVQVDDGSGTPRQICAGIRGHYTPEELVGRLVVIVANLAPRKMMGLESRGMLLAASDAKKGDAERRVILLSPSADIAPGAIVS